MKIEIAKAKAKVINDMLRGLDPLTRYYLSDFMSFNNREAMDKPDIWEALTEIEEDEGIDSKGIVSELRMGLELEPINVKVFLDDEDGINYEIQDDLTNPDTENL